MNGKVSLNVLQLPEEKGPGQFKGWWPRQKAKGKDKQYYELFKLLTPTKIYRL